MKQSFLISIISHTLILLGILTYTMTTNTPIAPGDSDHNAIDAYFYRDFVVSQNINSVPNSKKGIALNLKQSHLAHPVSQQQSHAASQGEKISGLLALLHNAIQKQQHYPESALEMEREGKVTAKFTLLTDGEVTHLAISHSSGTESLDMAALAAIRAAAPFTGVDQYIKQTGEYSIDVVFQIA